MTIAAIAPPKSGYRCTGCGRSTRSSFDVARSLGWRIWDGESVTGKPLSVRLCPYCAGEPDAEPPTWRVGCNTCDWEYDPTEDGEGPLDEKAAHELARDHQCEPWTWVKGPGEE